MSSLPSVITSTRASYPFHNSQPIVWTTGLMCPEAYTLHDAIGAYIKNESNESIRYKAALSYAQYQKCSIGAARYLLVTRW